jgi:formate dehydrogenase subunit delta
MSGQTLDKLIYMANQIAREFSAQRPREAVDATWDHLWHFWDPRMRAMILAHLRAGGDGLSDIAKQAVAKLAGDAEPESQTQATDFTHPGEDETEPMSDAG